MTEAAGMKHDRPVYDGARAWKAEAVKRFGEYIGAWRFRCPACGHEATCDDFKALGVDPNRATIECIGRVLNEIGRGAEVYREPPPPEVVGYDYDDEADVEIYAEREPVPSRRESGKPCNWAAFGLLGTLNEGTVVRRDGMDTWVFDFAEVKDGD